MFAGCTIMLPTIELRNIRDFLDSNPSKESKKYYRMRAMKRWVDEKRARPN